MSNVSVASTAPSVRRSVIWNLSTGPVVLLANLLLIPFAISICGANDYGIWVICFSAVSLLGQVDFGLGTAIVRQLSRYRSGGLFGAEYVAKRHAIFLFFVAAIVLPVVVVPVLLVYFDSTGGLNSAPLHVLVLLASFALFATIVARCFISIIQSYGFFHPERVLAVVGLLLKVVVLVAAALHFRSVIFVAMADLVSVLVLSFGSLFYVWRRSMLHAVPIEGVDVQTTKRELRQFGAPTFLSSFCSLMAMQLPLFFVGALVSFSDAAVFSALSRLLMSARASFGWVTAPSLPDVSKLGTAIDRSLLSMKVSKSILLITALTSVIVGPLLVSGRDFVDLWLGVDSRHAGFAIGAFGLTIFLYGIYSPGVVFATALGFPGVVARQNVLVLGLSLLASATLPRFFGLFGGAAALFLSIGAVFPWSIVVTSRLTGMHWGSVLSYCSLCLVYSSLGAYIGRLIADRADFHRYALAGCCLVLSCLFVGLFYACTLQPFLRWTAKLGR